MITRYLAITLLLATNSVIAQSSFKQRIGNPTAVALSVLLTSSSTLGACISHAKLRKAVEKLCSNPNLTAEQCDALGKIIDRSRGARSVFSVLAIIGAALTATTGYGWWQNSKMVVTDPPAVNPVSASPTPAPAPSAATTPPLGIRTYPTNPQRVVLGQPATPTTTPSPAPSPNHSAAPDKAASVHSGHQLPFASPPPVPVHHKRSGGPLPETQAQSPRLGQGDDATTHRHEPEALPMRTDLSLEELATTAQPTAPQAVTPPGAWGFPGTTLMLQELAKGPGTSRSTADLPEPKSSESTDQMLLRSQSAPTIPSSDTSQPWDQPRQPVAAWDSPPPSPVTTGFESPGSEDGQTDHMSVCSTPSRAPSLNEGMSEASPYASEAEARAAQKAEQAVSDAVAQSVATHSDALWQAATDEKPTHGAGSSTVAARIGSAFTTALAARQPTARTLHFGEPMQATVSLVPQSAPSPRDKPVALPRRLPINAEMRCKSIQNFILTLPADNPALTTSTVEKLVSRERLSWLYNGRRPKLNSGQRGKKPSTEAVELYRAFIQRTAALYGVDGIVSEPITGQPAYAAPAHAGSRATLSGYTGRSLGKLGVGAPDTTPLFPATRPAAHPASPARDVPISASRAAQRRSAFDHATGTTTSSWIEGLRSNTTS